MLFGKETRSLFRLDHTDILTSFQAIRDDWDKLRPALYAADLVDSLLAEADPHPRVFSLLASLLRAIAEGTGPRLAVLLRVFEAQLLVLVGYGPMLEQCVVCHRLATDAGTLSPRLGGYVCGACASEAPDAQRVSLLTLRLLHRLSTLRLAAAERLHLSPAQQSELKHVLHDLLNGHVRKEVKSYRFL